MSDGRSSATRLPSSIYVWLVPSEEQLEQPGSWRIRKWDTDPFPEANFTLQQQPRSPSSSTGAPEDSELRERIEMAQRDQTLERCALICEDQIAEDFKHARHQSRSILGRAAASIRALKQRSATGRSSDG